MNAAKSIVVSSGEARGGRPLDIYGNRIYFKVDGNDTGGAYAVFEGVVDSRQGPPLHRHHREDESFYVLEGEFLFEVDGTQIHAGPGTALYAPRGTAHTFQNIGTATGRVLTVVQPAGVDAFFAELDRATRGTLEPDLAVAIPIFERYGLELLGPPLGKRANSSSSPNSVRRAS